MIKMDLKTNIDDDNFLDSYLTKLEHESEKRLKETTEWAKKIKEQRKKEEKEEIRKKTLFDIYVRNLFNLSNMSPQYQKCVAFILKWTKEHNAESEIYDIWAAIFNHIELGNEKRWEEICNKFLPLK